MLKLPQSRFSYKQINFFMNKLKSPWSLVKESWHLYTTKFKLFVALSVPSIILAAASLATVVLPSAAVALVAIPLGIGTLIMNIWLGMSFLYGVAEQNPSVSAKEILRKGWKRFFSYLWLTTLSAAITMGGYFLLIIPGIMLSVWFGFALYALAAEDTRGLDALLRSKQLVKGLWWQVVWRFIFFALVFLVPIGIVFGVLAVWLGVTFVEKIEQFQVWADTLQTVLMPLQWIAGALSMAFAYVLFEDLKRVKGNPSYADYKESKGKYIALGILGVVGFTVFLIGMLVLLALGSLTNGGN